MNVVRFTLRGGITKTEKNLSGENEEEDLEFPLMEFEAVLIATEHFCDCNKIGKGDFGVVYKVKIMKESL